VVGCAGESAEAGIDAVRRTGAPVRSSACVDAREESGDGERARRRPGEMLIVVGSIGVKARLALGVEIGATLSRHTLTEVRTGDVKDVNGCLCDSVA